jgi:hypothetical protein
MFAGLYIVICLLVTPSITITQSYFEEVGDVGKRSCVEIRGQIFGL